MVLHGPKQFSILGTRHCGDSECMSQTLLLCLSGQVWPRKWQQATDDTEKQKGNMSRLERGKFPATACRNALVCGNGLASMATPLRDSTGTDFVVCELYH